VAIKIIYRALQKRNLMGWQQLVERIRGASHPFLLQIHTFEQLEDHLVIVTELAETSLADRLKACQQAGLAGVPAGELIRYFLEAAEALDYLHRRQLLHCDVKPANLLLLHGHAKLGDFALSELYRQGECAFAGTPVYLAPEAWQGKARPQSDQYALAISYAELRLGKRPFSGNTLMEVMNAHLRATPDLAPLPSAEQKVLGRALAKDPEKRYPNCMEFVRGLELTAPRS
jgi:serine/threonine protein kinase